MEAFPAVCSHLLLEQCGLAKTNQEIFASRIRIFIREWEKEWGLNGFDFQAIKQY